MIRSVKRTFTPAEYLKMEEAAEYKSEYYAGEIFAMAGGSSDHNLIAGNLHTALNQSLDTKPCRVYINDMRLLIQLDGLYTYPDVMVVCGKIRFDDRRNDTLTNPILIVEVLSESTREYDRGEKFKFYKQIPSLQEYILVESENARVECYRRGDGDKWMIEIHEGLDAVVKLESVECEISLRRIYNKVSWLE